MQKLELSRGKVALVDDEDYEWLSQWRWCCAEPRPGRFYAVRSNYETGKRTTLYLHRVIMECSDDMEIDHINHDGLDNRRANLRVCTHAENIRNASKIKRSATSPYKGVRKVTNSGLYTAKIIYNTIPLLLGSYIYAETAALVHDLFAREYHGKFATVNFPDRGLDDLQVALARERADNEQYQAKKSQRRVGFKYKHAKSSYRGVTPQEDGFVAKISTPNGRKYLGYFRSELDAARAYDAAALEAWGVGVAVNFGAD